jgi:hypothetical protein
MYKVCLKINATGTIKFYIYSWTINQRHQLQSNYLGKPHTAGDVFTTPGSSAESLCVNALSLSVTTFWMLSTVPTWRPLEWNLSFEKRQKSHGLRSGEVCGCGSTGIPYLSKRRSQRWHCDQERSRYVASKYPHGKFVGQNVVDGLVIQIQLTTNHCDCQMSIKLHESPHVGHVFFRFWRARSFRTRFVFYNLTAIQNALCYLKTCALDIECSP